MQTHTDARLSIKAHTSLDLDGIAVDLAALAALLEAVAETGSLQGAAERTGRSYRGAWGKISEAEERLGCRLVAKTKGHGSALTPAGSALASLVGRIERRVQALVEREMDDIDRQLRDCLQLGGARMRLACSHDLVLQQCLSEGRLAALDVRYMGSPKAVNALRASGLKVLAGMGLIGEDCAQAYQLAKVSLCLSARSDVAQRVFETAACGCAVFSDHCPDFEWLMIPGIAEWDGDDLVGTVHGILKDIPTAQAWASEAQAAMTGHSWTDRALTLLGAEAERTER